MYQSFTGSSRRPRQVNLSGRNTNPFAAAASSKPPSAGAQGAQLAIQNAHQDRQQRHQQRLQLNAAKNIQRVWRGHAARRRSKQEWRQAWDSREQRAGGGLGSSADNQPPYATGEQSLAALRSLLLFFTPTQEEDVERLLRYASRQRKTLRHTQWPTEYLRLLPACLAVLKLPKPSPSPSLSHADSLLAVLDSVVAQSPSIPLELLQDYYRTLSRLSPERAKSVSYFAALLSPLRSQAPGLAYQAFVAAYLTEPHAEVQLQSLASALASHNDTPLLIQGAATVVAEETSLDLTGRLWLLGQYVYILHETHKKRAPSDSSANILDSVPVIARLLASLSDEIVPGGKPLAMDNISYHQEILLSKSRPVPLNAFLQRQLQRLVDQDSIKSLLISPSQVRSSTSAMDTASDTTQLLAGYALTLLRVFPSRADDIRMWLYLGPSTQTTNDNFVPAIAYFWRGAKLTSMFQAVVRDPRAAISLLKASPSNSTSWQPPRTQTEQKGRETAEWRVIFVFLELYTFILKIMDDEEFLGQNSKMGGRATNNALPIADIKDLTVFLRNLGFAMQYYAQEITESYQSAPDALHVTNLSRYFGGASSQAASAAPEPEPKLQAPSVAGMTLEYLKGLVTGMARSVYERDSRRHFLPNDHWLMSSHFDMSTFIPAVVQEEQNRAQLQDQEEEVDDAQADSADEMDWQHDSGVQTGNRYRRNDHDNRLASRRRYLAAVAPRLEILRTMPFLIPFETRVQIFREFVYRDKLKRRNGYVDPELWRHASPMEHISKHSAKVRRKHEFEDAFAQFFSIGDGLKEPIQITFVDEFDIVEAGIDGGGVTKEFLTSVTSEAFNPERGLFQETKDHVLYPNPTSIEECKEMLRRQRHVHHANDKKSITDLLEKFEFLGRIVGKCLYEGILIDISFAAFFLSKWALYGNKEAGYRPSINDLRELDEDLYKGLLHLKYYPGNVEEDIPCTFAVTDEIPLGGGKVKTVETDLVPNGSNTPVTNGNRLIYINSMVRWRLEGQSKRQTDAFLRGLATIIRPSWLSMFNQTELQTLVGGAASSIDVSDLRRNTHYGGVYVIGFDGEEHPTVKLFWEVMETLDDADRGKVLKFVTSTPRAPLLGFGSLNPKFSIRDSGNDESRFPTTSTCVNLLKLPVYKSASVLKHKLLYAVNSGAGFDLS